MVSAAISAAISAILASVALNGLNVWGWGLDCRLGVSIIVYYSVVVGTIPGDTKVVSSIIGGARLANLVPGVVSPLRHVIISSIKAWEPIVGVNAEFW